MKLRKLALYSLAVIGLAFVALQLFVWLSPHTCWDNVIRTTVSPGREHEASLVITQCNDKAAPVLVLSVKNISGSNKEVMAKLGAATSTDIDLTWLSTDTLQVSYPPAFSLTQQPDDLNGIHIEFKEKRRN